MLRAWLTNTAVRTAARRWASGGPSAAEVLAPFSEVTPQVVAELETLCSRVITDPDDLAPYGTDWSGRYAAAPAVVVAPGSTAEVAAVLKYCSDNMIAVVPQGGNTSLVGGSVPLAGSYPGRPREVILSLKRMNTIEAIDEDAGVAHVQAGVILGDLESAIEPKGYTLPLDLGAKGSCHIGGNIATNAGGIRYVRYGSLHGSVLGLEVVLPSGEILDSRTALRKNNTGYDLKQLFIGSEGSLGIITGASLSLPPKPNASAVTLLAVDSFDGCIGLLRAAKRGLGEALSAVEFMDLASLEAVVDHAGGRYPLESKAPFYVVVEAAGASEEHTTQKMDAFLEQALTDEALAVTDGTLASDASQAAQIWHLREAAAEGILGRGKVYKYDVSLPTTQMYSMVDSIRERMAPIDGSLVVGYGHLGDANLHLNIAVPEYSDEAEALLEPHVYEVIQSMSGSISAEHGLGQMKASVAHYSQSPQALAWMRKIKDLFDPNGILNPGKMIV